MELQLIETARDDLVQFKIKYLESYLWVNNFLNLESHYYKYFVAKVINLYNK